MNTGDRRSVPAGPPASFLRGEGGRAQRGAAADGRRRAGLHSR